MDYLTIILEVWGLEVDNSKNIYEFIKNRIPNIEGYGECGRVDEDGVSNHRVFRQSIRTQNEGDIGIFEILTTEQSGTFIYNAKALQSEVQIVVNAVDGDIDTVEGLLNGLYQNIRTNKESEHICVQNVRLLNLRHCGQNTSSIHWSVLNILVNYLKV